MNKPVRIVFGETVKLLANQYNFLACNADTKCCAFEDFGEYYPEREFSIGIAEQNMVGIAAGLASCGNKVVLSTYSNFVILRACEQVRTYICNPKLNVMIMGTHAGLQTGSEGTSHTAIEDIAIARAFPNFTIIQPSDNISAIKLARLALEFEGPLYVRLPFDTVEDIHDDKYNPVIGKIDTIRDFGNDVSIFVTGILLGEVLKAVNDLLSENIKVKVLEVNTLKPIDKNKILEVAYQTRSIVTVEDHLIYCGLGSIIAEIVTEKIPIPIKRIGIQDKFIKSANARDLYKEHKMTAKDIVEAVQEVLKLKGELYGYK